MTNIKTKNKYFDDLCITLKKLSSTIDQDCPDVYKSDEMTEMIWESYRLLSEISSDNKIQNQNDREGNNLVSL